MRDFPSTADLGKEAREALRRSKETPHEHISRLIRLGWINSRGEVTRLLGGDAEPEIAAAGDRSIADSENGEANSQ